MWPAAPRSVLHPTTLLLYTATATILLATGVWGECGMEECTSAYLAGQQQEGGEVPEGATPAYCALLQRYSDCAAPLTSSCRGDLNYHTTKQWLSNLFERFNCSRVLSENPPPESPQLPPSSPVSVQDTCRYQGVSPPAHCGLFGDPHLKTFSGEYLTCGVRGAWPLLSNPHLAIQVTNMALSDSSDATATTKVTVIVKGHDTCGPERTYEASTEALPRAFVDGTTWAGGTILRPHTQVREERPGEHVLITVSYINATVAVRKIGKYLTVLVRVPEILVVEEEQKEEMQLCLQGCPENERLKGITHWMMSKEEAVKSCKEYNVTDYYLDACIFDLVTTGDKTFRLAALAAQRDLWEHDPAGAQKLLQNCSDPPCIWDVTSAARTVYLSKAFTTLLIFLLLGFSRRLAR